MNDLDANNDGEVDFTEFIILMGALTVACNDFFLEYKTDDKPGDGGKGGSAEKKNWIGAIREEEGVRESGRERWRKREKGEEL